MNNLCKGGAVVITAEDTIADVLTRYPHLKEKLLARSTKFKNLNNPTIFNMFGKFARIADVAKMAGEDLDEFLDFLNSNAQ